MMEIFKEHTVYICPDSTRHAVIISNDWMTEVYEEYYVYIERLIKKRREG